MSRRVHVRLAPTREQKIRALWDYWAFLDLISFHGGTNQFAQCHEDVAEWSTDIHGKHRKLHLLPRGHLKSTLLSVGKTLWRIYQNPNIRRFVGCSTRELSAAFIREIRAYLEDEWLQRYVWNARPHIEGRLIPVMDKAGMKRRDEKETEAEDKKIVWRSDAIQVLRQDIMKEPTVVAGSVGSIATGFHFDEIIFDDIITFDNADTPDKRDRVMYWIHDIESVLDPPWFDDWLCEQLTAVGVPKAHAEALSMSGGVIDVLGTRYDKDDYYGLILSKEDELGFDSYSRNIYANGVDRTDGYLWAERMNVDYERQLRASMSVRRFASQYLNIVLSPEEQVLTADVIHWVHPIAVKMKENGLVEITIGDHNKKKEVLIRPVLVVDPAASVSKQADFTAIGVGGCDTDKNLYVLDLKLGKWRTADWIAEMFALADKWKLKAVYLETCAFQVSLVSTIRSSFQKYRPIVIKEYRPNAEVHKKERLESTLHPLFANQMVYMTLHLAQNTELRDQINYFPRETMKDDGLDALAMMVECGKAPIVTRVENKVVKLFSNKKYGGLR